MPLEAGLAAATLANSGLANKLHKVAPVAARLARSLQATLDALKPIHRRPGRLTKMALVLDQVELERESRLIEMAAARFELGAAYRMAREWTVNRALLASGPEYASRWLVRDMREEAEAVLGDKYTGPHAKEGLEDPRFWPLRAIFTTRNLLAHAGFTDKNLRPDSLRREFEEAWYPTKELPDEVFRLLPREQGASKSDS